MTIKQGNKRLYITFPASIVNALEALGCISQKEISFYILRATAEKLEREEAIDNKSKKK
jgi:hypothetical protein